MGKLILVFLLPSDNQMWCVELQSALKRKWGGKILVKVLEQEAGKSLPPPHPHTAVSSFKRHVLFVEIRRYFNN